MVKKGGVFILKKILLSIFLAFSIFFRGGYAAAEVLTQDVKAALLMEASTGKILHEENADDRLPIASVTKIMTMLLIMERIETGALTTDEIITVSENAQSYGGSTMFLEAGEEISLNDILKGIAVASANDGCVAAAEHIAGSEAAFVEMMNKRAAELGMTNTHFLNTNGLDEDGQYSSARDVALMSRELLKHKKIYEYTTIWTDSLRDGKFALANTNRLIRFYKGATGLKTGSTSKAGCCLCATAERDGMTLIAVVLGAPDTKARFSSATALLNHGFSNYAIKKHIEKGEPIGSVKVEKGIQSEVRIEAAEGFSELFEKSGQIDTEKSVIFSDSIAAPIHKGDKLGEVMFLSDGKTIKKVDAVAAEDVEKKGLHLILADMLGVWISMV